MLKHEFENGILTVSISGEIDHHICSQLRAQTDDYISQYRPGEVILDFERVSFCDSSGIAFVMGRYRTVKNIGGKLKLVNVPCGIKKIFKLANLQKIVEIKENGNEC